MTAINWIASCTNTFLDFYLSLEFNPGAELSKQYYQDGKDGWHMENPIRSVEK